MVKTAEKKTPQGRKDVHGPAPVNQKVLRRLQSVAGQVDGISRMVEEQKYCIDILNQISAARSALNAVGLLILKRHIETCVLESVENGCRDTQPMIDELMAVLSRSEI